MNKPLLNECDKEVADKEHVSVVELSSVPTIADDNDDADDTDVSALINSSIEAAEPRPATKLTKLQLFWLFLSFGCQAFGGPVAQMQMMKVRFTR